MNDRLDERYELDRRLGQGGMAEVYLARDVLLERTVAVKVLRRSLADDPVAHARFRREARVAAGLSHPSIIAVHDTGAASVDGMVRPFLVMEYVDGPTLAETLADGPLSVGRALAYVADVLSALAYAHGRGIVHRDVKPANVMLTKAGVVKVTDFGLARPLDEVTEITEPAVLVGTAGYLSPEQIEGRPSDARSDLYAAGCLLYALLTGEPPFVAYSTLGVIHQHLTQAAPPPSTHRPGIPAEVDRSVLRAVEKDPASRFPDAEAMRRAVLAARASLPDPADSVAPAADTAGTAAPTAEKPARARVPATTARLPRPEADEPDADDEPAPRGAPMRTASRLGRATLAVLLAVVALVAASYLGARLAARPDRTVPVPDLLAANRDQAADRLARAGLRLGTEHHEHSDAPKGTISTTDPPGGRTLPRGAAVDIWISDGPGQVPVPTDLVGLSLDAATQALTAIGLTVDVTYQPSDQPAEQVLTADPDAGVPVALGGQVKLFVSCGNPDRCPHQ